MTEPLIELAGMSVTLQADDRAIDIVSGIDLALDRGERLGVVGESGSGKSIIALAIMGLLPEGMRVGGTLRFGGEDVATMPEARRCRLRGRQAAMIFQEPMTALNPIKSIGAQIAEGRRLHFGESRAVAERKARMLLDRVGLPAPRFDLSLYPHQLSGGQRQRVMIAMAIACEPQLLIADEPTTALDVTVQAQILDLVDELVDEQGTALMLITHDLGIVSEMTERIAVLYAGRLAETGRTQAVFGMMAHPYTSGLFSASPHGVVSGDGDSIAGRRRLAAIPGTVPDPRDKPSHCAFAGRCAFVQTDCRATIPPLAAIAGAHDIGHHAACFHPRTGAASQ